MCRCCLNFFFANQNILYCKTLVRRYLRAALKWSKLDHMASASKSHVGPFKWGLLARLMVVNLESVYQNL